MTSESAMSEQPQAQAVEMVDDMASAEPAPTQKVTKIKKRRWPVWAKPFLKSLSTDGHVTRSCKAAGIEPSTAYDLRHADEAFAEAWEFSLDGATEVAEREMWRRAVKGVKEPIYYKGMPCGHIRRYSDTLLIFMLKGRKPDVYRDNPPPVEQGDITINLSIANVVNEVLRVQRGPIPPQITQSDAS